MPEIKNSRARAGAHIQFENQEISRTNRTLKMGGVFSASAVLGEISATKKLVVVNAAASDGSETACGVLFREVDATFQDEVAAVNDYHTVFKRSKLVFPEGATQSQIDGWINDLESKSNRVK